MRVPLLFDAFRRRYGAGPVHLAGHLVALAIALFALDRIFSLGDVKELLLWFVGLAIVHDLVFVPAYSVLDRGARKLVARLPARPAGAIPIINHVRAPAVISGILLIVFLPMISGRSDSGFQQQTGHVLHDSLRNWLLITAGLFLASGAIYALRVVRRATAYRR